MSFVRPEARAQIWRWREAIVGVAAVVFGVWMVLGGRGALAILGVVCVLAGIGLVFAGWQRARFRHGTGGPGVVYVTEGQVTYFGPQRGGAVAIAAISDVILHPVPGRGQVWEIRAPGRDALFIPIDAEGTDALFDAFGALDDFPTEKMLDALNTSLEASQTIWSRRLLH